MKTTAHHIASRLGTFSLSLTLLLIAIGMGCDLKAQESDDTSTTSKNIGEETIVMHRIDNKTTADELSTIATQAAEVGVNFSYNTNRMTGRLKNVQARIKRSEKNGKYCWQAYGKHDMELTIGWVVDAEGDAVRLIDGNQEIVGLMECKAICDEVSEGEIPRIADIDQSLMAQNQIGPTDTKSIHSGLSV